MILSYDYASPKRGQQQMKAPPWQAFLIAMAVRQCNNAHIYQWRNSRAFIKATKHHHWASTRSNSNQSDMPTPDFGDISLSNRQKRARVNILAPNMTYQTDGNIISKTNGYLVGGGQCRMLLFKHSFTITCH